MPDKQSKVLIVDDDRALAQLSSMWLKSAGYQTHVANDGNSGLAAAESLKPDLIVLDIRMPDIDGLEVMRRLKATPAVADIPVVFLSASVQERVRKEAITLGAKGFLGKPYDPDKLSAAVSSALSRGEKSAGQKAA